MKPFDTFLSQYVFDAKKASFVGIEREAFIMKNGLVVPDSPRVIDVLSKSKNIKPGVVGYELSACQLELRLMPCEIEHVLGDLSSLDLAINHGLAKSEYSLHFDEVGDESMSLDVFPDPTGRYKAISSKMPVKVLRAACIVTGTHIHIGMPDHKTALRVYNKVIKDCDRLIKIGDGSNGRRMDYYKVVAPDYIPQPFSSWKGFFDYANKKGFVYDPRSCWTLIRITKHGTIEFRMFGSTPDVAKIASWAQECHRICSKSM